MFTAKQFQRAQRDAADHRALHDYVEALPRAERIAYYRANPDYMLHGYPAHLVQRANALTAQGQPEVGQRLLTSWQEAQWAEEARATPVRGPGFAGRLYAAFIGLWIPGLCTAASAAIAASVAGAAGLHVVVAIGGAATACNALYGFATGWQS